MVIPSTPGYGYSGRANPRPAGDRRSHRPCLGRADATPRPLECSVAQGGDWAAVVVDLMGVQELERIALDFFLFGVVFPPQDPRGCFFRSARAWRSF